MNTLVTLILLTIGFIVLFLVLLYWLKRQILFLHIQKSIKNKKRMKKVSSLDFTLYKFAFFSWADKWEEKKFLEECGISLTWVNMTRKKMNKRIMAISLRFFPEECYYPCFISIFSKTVLKDYFLNWLSDYNDKDIIYQSGLNYNYEKIEGKLIWEYLGRYRDYLVDMAQFQENQARYFAISALLNDDSPSSLRLLLDRFSDPVEEIRSLIIEQITHKDRDTLFNYIFKSYIHDSSSPVRKTAKERIVSDFSDLYTLNIDNMDRFEQLHILEQLDSHSKVDENLAWRFLIIDHFELQYISASYLNDKKALQRCLMGADLGDSEDLESRYSKLKNAVAMHITDFLNEVKKGEKPGQFYLAARLLLECENRELVTFILKRIYSIPYKKENSPLYEIGNQLVSSKGNRNSYEYIVQVLEGNTLPDKEKKELVKALPVDGEQFFVPYLLKKIKSGDSWFEEAVIDKMGRFHHEHYIDELYRFIYRNEVFNPDLCIRSLKVLTRIKQPVLLMNLLERISLVEEDTLDYYFTAIHEAAGTQITELVDHLLKTNDSRLKSALLRVLPLTKNTKYIAIAESSLQDFDYNIRKAAIVSASRFQNTESINKVAGLLYDPVLTVRKTASFVLGKYGEPANLKYLKKILNDPTEIEEVVLPVIEGLAGSPHHEALDILSHFLEETENYTEKTIQALSNKSETDQIVRLISHFTKGSSRLRKRLVKVFILMEEIAESRLMDLLHAGTKPDYNESIYEILVQTGAVYLYSRKIRKMGAEERLKTVNELALIKVSEAFRIIMLYAKDPVPEIRTAVIKAVEELTTSRGKGILDELSKDPSRKVRRYTEWAKSRVNLK